jgi:hypothetical protein
VFPAVTVNNELLFFKKYKELLVTSYIYGITADQMIKRMGHDDLYILAMLCNVDVVMDSSFLKSSRIIKPENFVKNIKKWQLHDWFVNQTASWNIHYQADFKEVITKRGFGFVFNFMSEDSLFTEK